MKKIVLTILFFVFSCINTMAGTVPLPSITDFTLNSHAEWRQYQLAPILADWPNQRNNNCGPASVSSVLKLYYNLNLSTEINSAPQTVQDNHSVETEARWNYHVANGVSGGFDGSYNSGEYSGPVSRVLKYNGLETMVLTGSSVTLEAIKDAIDYYKVVICHVNVSEYYSSSSITSHWVVAFGYTDADIIINDPGYIAFANHSVSNQNFTNALNNANGGNDKVLIVVKTPKIGWMADRFDYEKAFIDAYLEYGGVDMFGLPWDNGGSLFVHEWPDAGFEVAMPNTYNVDGVFVQDFINNGHWWQLVLNTELNEVYPVHGQLLTFWHNNYGYAVYGPPSSLEYNKRNSNGDLLVIQEFEGNNVLHYLGYDTVSGVSREYSILELYPMESCEPEDDVNYYVAAIFGGPGGGYFLTSPYNLQASALSDTAIQLTWTLPITDPENYNVRVYRINSQDNDVLEKDILATDSTVLDNLSQGTEYCYYVSLVDNTLGIESESSVIVCVATDSSAPPPPPPTWSVSSHLFTAAVGINPPHDPIDLTYSYEKKAGENVNYWVKVVSADQNLSFEWKLYHQFTNTRFYDATQGGSGTPSYYGDNYLYYDTVNQEYILWHGINANSLGFFGQYRAELWIDGQKASNCFFDLTMEKPSILNIVGEPSNDSVTLFWSTLGDSREGSGVELFRDSEIIAFVPGVSTGYTDTTVVSGEEYE